MCMPDILLGKKLLLQDKFLTWYYSEVVIRETSFISTGATEKSDIIIAMLSKS